MAASFRRATSLVALSLLLGACGPQAQATSHPTEAPTSAPTATLAPTATPAPTAVPLIADGVTAAGVKLGGMDAEQARAALADVVKDDAEPVTLVTGGVTTTLEPEAIGLAPDVDAMVAKALTATAGDDIPLVLIYDEAKLKAALDALAPAASNASSGVEAIRDTKAISASFVLHAAESLDVDAALPKVEQHLATLAYTQPLTLELTLAPPSPDARPTKEQLQQELEALAEAYAATAKKTTAVLGVYIYDLKSGDELASVNKGTAFSTASTIKVGILLNAYAHVDSFTAKQMSAIEKMVIDSDNLRANDVMAMSVGGTSTESAFEGIQLMSDTLADLGLTTTYQYTPFEANDFIKLYKPKYKVGPKKAGEAPFTNSSPVQRTTPYEMAQIYVLIDQCAKGGGKLVEKFPETMTAKRCAEMIELLKRNADTKRMVSGLPEGTEVAHKSGWAQPEVQGDAGIVRTPGGDFVIAIYAYQSGEVYKDTFTQRLLGNVARLAYSYYNPLTVSGE
ncbi:serine hydrolase [Chloroflexia bacterium SDU3-3]|nr:serine hydrolase [Chloroflexia bacterium SDU3-3]